MRLILCVLLGCLTYASAATVTLVDGGQYKGELEGDKLHGKGTLHWPDGSYYSGEFSQGLMHGTGERLFADKSTYVGQFFEGQPHGTGTLTSSDGIQFIGQFENGHFVSGETTDEFGSVYKGQFKQLLLHGEGKVTLPDGSYWSGSFSNGYLNGKGSYIQEGGDAYFGDFLEGLYHGEGELALADGTYLKGEFEYGVFQGDIEQLEEPTFDEIALAAERALYEQSNRLKASLDAVPQGDPDTTELFFVGIAGDGSQRVFEREVLFAKELLNDRFELNDRAVILANSEEASKGFVLATQYSIEQALKTVAEKMDAQQDILFVYMTSHGSRNHEFYLNHQGIRLSDFSAESFSEVVNQLPVKHKIIGVSACYSGGFLPLLKDEFSLVFTAADSDSTSFGCSDDNDFTYFGRALFEQALSTTQSFRYAFHQAYDFVKQWESDEGYDHSNPLLWAPESAVTYIDHWASQLDSYQEYKPEQTQLAKWWLREKVQTVTQQ